MVRTSICTFLNCHQETPNVDHKRRYHSKAVVRFASIWDGKQLVFQRSGDDNLYYCSSSECDFKTVASSSVKTHHEKCKMLASAFKVSNTVVLQELPPDVINKSGSCSQTVPHRARTATPYRAEDLVSASPMVGESEQPAAINRCLSDFRDFQHVVVDRFKDVEMSISDMKISLKRSISDMEVSLTRIEKGMPRSIRESVSSVLETTPLRSGAGEEVLNIHEGLHRFRGDFDKMRIDLNQHLAKQGLFHGHVDASTPRK